MRGDMVDEIWQEVREEPLTAAWLVGNVLGVWLVGLLLIVA